MIQNDILLNVVEIKKFPGILVRLFRMGQPVKTIPRLLGMHMPVI